MGFVNNKDKMIKEAAMLMAEMGYSVFTMDLLIEKTSIAKSNAYYHFATKELLGLAVLDYWCNTLETLHQNTITNTNIPINQRLNEYFSKLIHFQEVTNYCGDPITNIASEIRTSKANAFYKDRLNNFHQSCVSYLSAGVNQKCFVSNLNINSVAWLCVSLITAATQEARIQKDTQPMFRARDQICSLLKTLNV